MEGLGHDAIDELRRQLDGGELVLEFVLGEERSFLLAADDHSEKGAPTLYNYLEKLRKDKSQLEATRLLYVGATRAIRRVSRALGDGKTFTIR